MRRSLRVLAGVASLLCAGYAHAERATERYAPTQISVARDFLERARAAASLEEYETARLYAQQAELDARIAWGMTDAALLHAQAASIASQAAAIDAAAVRPPPPPAVDLTRRVQAQAGTPTTH